MYNNQIFDFYDVYDKLIFIIIILIVYLKLFIAFNILYQIT